MNDQRRFSIRKELVFKKEEDVAFLFDPATGDLKFANATATTIISMLNAKKTVASIVDRLCRQYPDVSAAQIEKDLEALIAGLADCGFIVVYGADTISYGEGG
jgi:hypothetical protein